jgi:2-C-methyl-D-erythritol 4-phosphate cytidylyltransferase
MKIFAVIPAAGKGSRSGSSVPKQFIRFKGKELIAYTLEVFQRNKKVDEIIIPAAAGYFDLLKKIKKRFKLNKIRKIIHGGKERQDSVFNALKEIAADKDDLIIVHDAARPLLPDNVLDNAISMAVNKGSAVACIKACDTLINGDDAVKKYIERKDVYYVQTPQIFKYADLKNAMEKAYKLRFYGTDESALVKRIGKKIYIAEGSPLSFKITTESDLHMFSMIIDKT